MSYIGAEPTTAAFPFDQFSGNGTTTAFTLTYAPASVTSIIVSITGVVQNPNTYSVIGTTLNLTPAPPIGTNNIAVLYLGLPVIGVSNPGNTAFFSATDITATGGQVTFTPSGAYTPGFVTVFRNGARLGNADYTATNGVTITLVDPAVAGDIITIETFILSSLVNALPLTGGTVTGTTTFNSTVAINGANVSGFTGFKNRIINGDMRIDQRNNGASITGNDGAYPVDRFTILATQTSRLTVQQSTIAPAGFGFSLLATSSSAYSVLSSDQFTIQQRIEGFNTADLNFGTASASTITLSFWVRSSLTGTFGGALTNSAYNRTYPFSYVINSANTWEQKSVTIAGDTTGTWVGATNGVGLRVSWSLGAGASQSGTAGAWAASGAIASSGQVNLVSTNGATFYITGVTLERGSNATSFEFRDYGRELILCQRYYEKSYDQVTVAGTATASGCQFAYAVSGSNIFAGGGASTQFKVTKRSAPSVTVYSTATGAAGFMRNTPGASDVAATADAIGDSGFRAYSVTFTATNAINLTWQYVAISEL